MSYDLAVFDPRADLRERGAFYEWYDATTEWEDGYDYSDPSHATEALRNWFMEMIQTFPAMNGPFAPDGTDETVWDSRAADYCIAPDIIYVTFGWSQAEAAYEACKRLAEKHGVGFHDVSSREGSAWFPGAGGKLVVVHQAEDE